MTSDPIRDVYCFYFANGFNTNHFNVWIHHIPRGRHTYLLCSDAQRPIPADTLDRIHHTPNLKLVTVAELEADYLGKPEFKGFLYCNNRRANRAIMRKYRGLVHAHLGHGESEKNSAYSWGLAFFNATMIRHEVILRRFSPFVRSRMKAISVEIGSPLFEGALRSEPACERSITDVLYAPTWEEMNDEGNFSSVPWALDKISAFAHTSGVRVHSRLHPTLGKRQPEIREQALAAQGLTPSSLGKVPLFAQTQILIADMSGIASEFLMTGRPVIIPWSKELDITGWGFQRYVVQHPWAYIWDVANQDLGQLVAEISGSDPLREQRVIAQNFFYGPIHSDADQTVALETALDVVSSDKPSRRRLIKARQAVQSALAKDR